MYYYFQSTIFQSCQDVPIENVSGTGKTVVFSGKTMVIPVIFDIVITVENSGNITKFYH